MADLRPDLEVFEHPFAVPCRIRLPDGRLRPATVKDLGRRMVQAPSGGDLVVTERRWLMGLRVDQVGQEIPPETEIELGGRVYYVDGVDYRDNQVIHVFVRVGALIPAPLSPP